MDSTQELTAFITNKLTEIAKLLAAKTEQYATEDALDNFRKGARLQFGNDSYAAMYEVLKGYELKHITQVFKQLGADKQDECMMDVIIYNLIGLYMFEKRKRGLKE